MSLAKLILQLDPLLQRPQANLSKVIKLLRDHQDLAEYEVARFYASEALLPDVERMARSADPRDRARAAEALRLCGTQATASRLLRPMVKDQDQRVRSRARHALQHLGLNDVALPDFRIRPPRRPGVLALGGHNPTGWSFGLFRGDHRVRRPKKPPRAQQLARQALPPLKTVAELRALLGIKTEKELRRLLRPGAGPGAPYVEFSIPKRSGGERRIAAPRAPLRRVQRAILREILGRLAPHEASHGFVPRRSVLTNARPHEGAALVIKMDLKDFFPTLHYRRVQGFFTAQGFGEEVAAALAGLCTHRPRLEDGVVLWPGVVPQGAPTSPALANLLCRRLDARLSGLAERVGAVYTRYADDLTFSFAAPPQVSVGRFLWWVEGICQQEGFVENTEKRRVLRKGQQQRITGVVVNAGLRVPRETRRTFRAILANCRKHGVSSQARGRSDFRAYLLGYAAYVQMIQPELGRRLRAEVRALLQDPSA